MNFVEELKWRGMIHDIMPGTEEQLEKEMTTAYVGIDPTADSLHIGHLVGVMMLRHFQAAGHRPIVLLGGATGMIGDPSMKSQERNLLDEETLRHNQKCLKEQLSRFLDFETTEENRALMVNNYDWMKDFTFLEFIRDVGKHITVNYMMAKDSVKKRLGSDSREGLSFTEFTYQLVQGYDFLHLYEEYDCKLQMGGSDQWGNITTGTELIRRKTGGEAFALTCPLITKADGGKFGKTESGNVWLDPERTSPYAFYQFWLNASDADAEKYIKIFTLIPRDEIEALIDEHNEAPHQRKLQKRLAETVTRLVHGEEALQIAIDASQILFGKNVTDILKKLDERTLLSVFEGVPTFSINRKELDPGIGIIDLVAEKTEVFPSKGEARRTIKGGGLALNKEKVTNEELIVKTTDLLNNKYLLVQKGKKNYFLIIAE
ncbi:MAG: tyrosine--tRNA ligase [Anaerophaga sp.]|uniref:tyrosine--tRNA ligase n=1 Tax=Anaerophaga thermohalophila TaxID=177400 RepID=UPI000237CFC4|nr:tyrosine--tRNA ligase [Anaerophaga thermohalophila]MBZ4675695.1 tyrosine--tRNA ligase [Anaerophaga sp.]MDI3520271.1 tyrosyl-tRNA synthetase [Anaerophaga sp.]MDK2840715.1 tyrosyl-tRNA synthetase [Anaerophaga sp.]MDN5292204.1 tyrosyl-tRNA synthetase [Anaerophaga sp.]